jgi:hypothetical protein
MTIFFRARGASVAILTAAACAVSIGAQAQTASKPSPKESAAACAAETKNPLECYVTVANARLFICQLSAENAALRQALYTCDIETKAEMKPYYDLASSSLAKNKKALELLKDYAAAWQTALAAMTPGQSETQREYHARVEALQRKVEERGNRLLLEK